ncbi:MAG: hypothetical protein VKM34_04455 [Cyanobacteriota bacterium]|nr:hypothetical protein [Cyanobacteriota bacterium]
MTTTAQPTAAAAAANSASAATAPKGARKRSPGGRSKATAAPSLPDLEAPSIHPSTPSASYKLAFADPSRWYLSRDGGSTTEPTASAVLAGAAVDLALLITPARQRPGDDIRLRLAFQLPDGPLVELNLNAVSTTAEGMSYVTSPVRSLTGALLQISQAEEDMQAFCRGVRFSIHKGRGRGVFIETDIAASGRWIAMSGALATLQISKQPEAFCQQLLEIKQRFNTAGLLSAAPAIHRPGTQQ